LERGSSGRDVFYRMAWNYIEQQPLLGYGPFGFRDNTIHAHNIFLEVWLQFGVFGLLFFLLAGLALIAKAVNNKSKYTIWVVSLAAYPVVMTMFSGTYMHSAIYFFL
jgi:O-antigen ligase